MCILYDNEAKGVRFLEDYAHFIPDYVPRLIIRSKCDLKYSKSEALDLEILNYIKLKSSEVITISSKIGNIEDLKQKLAIIIEKP